MKISFKPTSSLSKNMNIRQIDWTAENLRKLMLNMQQFCICLRYADRMRILHLLSPSLSIMYFSSLVPWKRYVFKYLSPQNSLIIINAMVMQSVTMLNRMKEAAFSFWAYLELLYLSFLMLTVVLRSQVFAVVIITMKMMISTYRMVATPVSSLNSHKHDFFLGFDSLMS